MRKILKLTISDYKRRWNKPVVVLLYVLSPVIITLVMWLAFGGAGSSDFAPLKVAVVNNDEDGMLSHIFINAFSNENTKDKIQAFIVSPRKANELINKRKVSGIIIIPEDFTKKIFKSEKTEIKLIKNPSEMIYPMIAETGLYIVKDITNYFLTIFKDEIEIIRTIIEEEDNPDSSVLTFLYEKIGDKLKKIIPLFEEEKISIEDIKKKEEKIPMAVFFFPGMSIFFLFFISNAILADMVKERNEFIIKRLFLSELKKSDYYFARLLSAIFFIFTIEIFLSVTGRLLFNLKIDSIYWLFAAVLISSTNLSLLSTIIMAISHNENQVRNIGMVFIFLFAILGGSLIPVNALPSAIRHISFISPLYYMIESFIALALHNKEHFIDMISISFFIATGLFITSYILNIRALKKVVK